MYMHRPCCTIISGQPAFFHLPAAKGTEEWWRKNANLVVAAASVTEAVLHRGNTASSCASEIISAHGNADNDDDDDVVEGVRNLTQVLTHP